MLKIVLLLQLALNKVAYLRVFYKASLSCLTNKKIRRKLKDCGLINLFLVMVTKNCKKGFTLVELSIVLIIIGVLVAGIISGREIIRQAEYRSVISDYERFVTAYNTFEGLYGRIPGDLSVEDARELLGDDEIEGGGDGNGLIAYFPGGEEAFREINAAWEHLSISGILSGEFEGLGDELPLIDNNLAPLSRIQGGLYVILNEIDGSPSADFDTPYPDGLKANSNYIFLTSEIVAPSTFTSDESAIIDVVGASYIDRKLDNNENPVKGRVRAGGTGCVDDTVEDEEVYDYAANGKCFVGIEF